MTVTQAYANHYIEVKYFLSSYRALSDGRLGIANLEKKLDEARFLASDWKIIWIGTCTILRTAIDLFQRDSGACISNRLRAEIKSEWDAIKREKDKHSIFWNFLRKERDSIIHEYDWRAYEQWIKPDGTYENYSISLLMLGNLEGAKPVILMRDGEFQGQNSLDLLKEGANWVEDRIFSAIRRAGLDPDERRSLGSFSLPPAADLTGGVLKSAL